MRPTWRTWRRAGVFPIVFHREAEAAQRVIGLLKATFTHLVLDLSKSYSPIDLVALEMANHILLVTQLDLPCLRNIVRLMMSFEEMEGVADKEAIDTVMKLGMAHPMGPLTLADFIGLDICLDIMEVLYDGFGDSKYRPCPLLRRMVDAGYLGRKSGKGFYDYE